MAMRLDDGADELTDVHDINVTLSERSAVVERRNAPVLAHHIARTSGHADLENMHLNCPNPLDRGTCAYADPDNARVRSRRRLRLVWAVGRWAQ